MEDLPGHPDENGGDEAVEQMDSKPCLKFETEIDNAWFASSTPETTIPHVEGRHNGAQSAEVAPAVDTGGEQAANNHMAAIETEIDDLMRATASNVDTEPIFLKFQTDINGVVCVSSTPEHARGPAEPPARWRQKRCVHHPSKKCRNRYRNSPSRSVSSSLESSDSDAVGARDDQPGPAAGRDSETRGVQGGRDVPSEEPAGGRESAVGVNAGGQSGAYVFPGIAIRAAGESSSAANSREGFAAGGTHALGAARGDGNEDYVNPVGNIQPERQVEGGDNQGAEHSVRGSGAVSGRMMSNLRLQIGMVRTVVKNKMGDKFPGKAGLKHEEPTAKDVLYFCDRMLTCTRR